MSAAVHVSASVSPGGRPAAGANVNVAATGATVSISSESSEVTVNFQGYGNVTENGDNYVAPPPPPPALSGPPPSMEFRSTGIISEVVARQALLDFANSRLCYGTACAKEMTINSMSSASALEYILETFAEGRRTYMSQEPYSGGFVDGPQYGPPPAPWSIACSPDALFSTHSKDIEVPHTSVVKRCTNCNGLGYKRCLHCNGVGISTCQSCDGRGGSEGPDSDGGTRFLTCGSCNGAGRVRCTWCSGDGRVTCQCCNGYGNLRTMMMLEVLYTNHRSNYVTKNTNLPSEIISNAAGITVFEQAMPQVWPITSHPVPEINAQSQQLVLQHQTAFPQERQLQQRQTLRAIPVTEIDYSWKDHRTRYWVYGTDNVVYAPDYPQQCCCTIL